MGTETTRVSSYFRSEGLLDSAGTRYQNASAVNLLVSGLTTGITASALNNVFSGITASANASMISNLFSGLASTVTAGMITGYALRAATADAATTALAASTSLAAASASYAASAGTLSGVTATAGRINALMYSTAAHKSVYGSTAITASATIGVTALGLTTLAAFVYTKTVSCTDYMTFTTTGVVVSLMSGATAATGTIYFMAVND
ncbi:MAG: hypothetical protein PHH61_05660 [Candidatus Nanoarchaeia archaeon]|nr:hypothetical protein [Candidatus Nanoarchaeia archaeon]